MNEDVESFYPWLRKVALDLVGKRDHEDVAQEGWLAMWRSLESYDPEKGSKNYWLKYKAYSRMRTVRRNLGSKKEDATEIGADDISCPPGEWHNLYHNPEIWSAIKILSPREREYIFLRFWGGYKLPEMRQHFGYEPSGLWTTAKRKLNRQLKHLQGVEGV